MWISPPRLTTPFLMNSPNGPILASKFRFVPDAVAEASTLVPSSPVLRKNAFSPPTVFDVSAVSGLTSVWASVPTKVTV